MRERMLSSHSVQNSSQHKDRQRPENTWEGPLYSDRPWQMLASLRDAISHAGWACDGHRTRLAAAAIVLIAETSSSIVQSRQIPGETSISRIFAHMSQSVLGSPPEVDFKFTGSLQNVTSLIICIVVGLAHANSSSQNAVVVQSVSGFTSAGKGR